jgi:hypothetical protein
VARLEFDCTGRPIGRLNLNFFEYVFALEEENKLKSSGTSEAFIINSLLYFRRL